MYGLSGPTTPLIRWLQSRVTDSWLLPVEQFSSPSCLTAQTVNSLIISSRTLHRPLTSTLGLGDAHRNSNTNTTENATFSVLERRTSSYSYLPSGPGLHNAVCARCLRSGERGRSCGKTRISSLPASHCNNIQPESDQHHRRRCLPRRPTLSTVTRNSDCRTYGARLTTTGGSLHQRRTWPAPINCTASNAAL